MKSDHNARLNFSGPAKYRIIVKGEIPSSQSKMFGGFNISVRDTQANEYETFLEGDILDQAALASVLDAIYSLRLPLIAVNYLEENNFDMKKNSNTN